MKKITLLALGLLISGFTYGQQILSQSTDNMTVEGSGVACAGGGTTADNIWSRTYTPADFGFSGDFSVMGARFFPTFTDVSGGATTDYTVRISSSDAAYPTGTLTTLGETSLTVTQTESGIEQEVMLDNPVIIDATTILVIEVVVLDNVDPEQYDARIGVNAEGENSPGYIVSEACGLTTPTTFADIGFPDNHIILDLLGDQSLSVDSTFLSNNVSVSPNPTNGDININFARNFGPTTVAIVNVSGQKVLNTSVEGFGNKTISTSALATGIYFAQVTTETGSTTIKIMKN